MIVDGKQIATDILAAVQADVETLEVQPVLVAITCAPNFETIKYLEMKKRRAAAVGIVLNVVELPADASTVDVVRCVIEAAARSHGVVVQLPMPPHIDRDEVLAAVPIEKDPDGFQYGKTAGACMSPVVGAIDEISKRHQIDWTGKRVTVLGAGRLVGAPAAHYAEAAGAEVTVHTADTFTPGCVQTADIIISGIGKPHVITSEMVKDGVAVFDAGTSEDGGVLAGDVHPDVANKAALMTPVPGGIGPITIAYLLKNVVSLARQTT